MLSSDEVDRMVKDAETNATSDKAKRDAIDTKNNVRSASRHWCCVFGCCCWQARM